MIAIKLDENISKHLKPELQRQGYDVLTAADEHLLGHSDQVIAQAARKERRVLFTLDLEFADLRKFPPGTHPGIVLFRPKTFGPLAVNRFILSVASQIQLSDVTGCIVVVDPNKARIRRP